MLATERMFSLLSGTTAMNVMQLQLRRKEDLTWRIQLH